MGKRTQFKGVVDGDLFGNHRKILNGHKILIVTGADLVLYLCPQCNKEVALELGSGDKPRWKMIRENDGTVSFVPSVVHNEKMGGCGAHYIIKNNQIVWC